MPGWPVDVAQALGANHLKFTAASQNQRGALTIVNGMVYVPFGGHFGDCGDYRGWVVGISLADPTTVVSWATRARGGGIWAPGGISSVGQSLFVATGNTFGASTWSDGEAVFRLPLDLHHSEEGSTYFAPGDWLELDHRDADLGGTNPVPSICKPRTVSARSCSRSARTDAPISSTGITSVTLAARWRWRPYRMGRSAPRRPPFQSLTGCMSLFRGGVPIALPADAAIG